VHIHMSWPLLLPFAGAVALARARNGWRHLVRDGAALAGGFAVPGLLLLPTLVRFGIQAGSGGTVRNLHVHFVAPWVLLETTARFLAFASLEVLRFLGTDTAKRVVFVSRHLWIAPLAAVVWAVGVVHPLYMACQWFRRRHPDRDDWPALKRLVVGAILTVFAAYFFVLEPPQAHAFYVLSPVAMVFAAYCWSFVDRPSWRRVAAVVLGTNILFHLGLALALAPTRSLYKNRPLVAAAVSERNTNLFAHRRAYARDAIAGVDDVALRDPRGEVELQSPGWSIGPARAILWDVTLRNGSPNRAYRDLLYRTFYEDAGGTVLYSRVGYVLDVFQPGEVRRIEINDGSADRPFARARLELIQAEALEPLRK
jgi:hypothetical protein